MIDPKMMGVCVDANKLRALIYSIEEELIEGKKRADVIDPLLMLAEELSDRIVDALEE